MSIAQRNRLISGAAVALFVLPLAIDLAFSGPEAPFRYFNADAFYYHTVARNWAHLGYPTFDQLHATNGFHPLWQAALAASYVLVEHVGGSELCYLYVSIFLGAAAIAASVTLLASTLALENRPLPAAFVLLPIGAYGCFVLPAWVLAYGYVNLHEGQLPLYGTLWSYANGMESAPVLLCHAALLRLVADARWHAIAFGLGLGSLTLLTILSRLDHALLVAPVLAYPLLRAWRARDRARMIAALSACAVCVVSLGAYLLINRMYAGALMPISGSAKTTFPRPQLGGVRWLMFSMWRSPLSPGWLDGFCRQAQLLIPAGAALWWLVSRPAGVLSRRFQRLEKDQGIDLALSLTAIGVLLLCGYDFSFVPMFATGPWYAPVPVVFVSVVLLRVMPSRSKLVMPLIAFAGANVLVFTLLQRREGYHREFAELYLRDAAHLLEHYAPERPKLVEGDDGIVAFSTGLPCMSGFGFTDDVDAARARRSGTFLALARARGFRRWISLAYAPNCARGSPECAAAAVRNAEGTFGPDRTRFALEYRSQVTRLVVVSLDE